MKNKILSICFGLIINIAYSQCDDGYVYIDDYPDNVNVLDGGNCFYQIDIDVLEDVISENELDLDEGLLLGSQTWIEGRLRFFIAGNYYSGGYVTLSTIPESFGNLTELRMLYLNWNNLTSIPESFDQLINLIYLVLSNNQLISTFDNIGNLENLYYLDLGYNALESIPESIGELQNLQYLYIFVNQLTTLPDSICDLNINWDGLDYTFLPFFGSGGNLLCDYVPECIANSIHFNIALDQTYYAFAIDVPQECDDPYTLGDVNNDGSIDVLDIVLVVGIILDTYDPTDTQLLASDLNIDGDINVLDIVLIVDIILS